MPSSSWRSPFGAPPVPSQTTLVGLVAWFNRKSWLGKKKYVTGLVTGITLSSSLPVATNWASWNSPPINQPMQFLDIYDLIPLSNQCDFSAWTMIYMATSGPPSFSLRVLFERFWPIYVLPVLNYQATKPKLSELNHCNCFQTALQYSCSNSTKQHAHFRIFKNGFANDVQNDLCPYLPAQDFPLPFDNST